MKKALFILPLLGILALSCSSATAVTPTNKPIEITLTDLISQYNADSKAADTLYKDKLISTDGILQLVSQQDGIPFVLIAPYSSSTYAAVLYDKSQSDYVVSLKRAVGFVTLAVTGICKGQGYISNRFVIIIEAQ